MSSPSSSLYGVWYVYFCTGRELESNADAQLGLWTTKIGFHNTWEFWFYNVLFGLGQAPYYAYAQALMSDLCPPGYEGMFCMSHSSPTTFR